jgi:hypothetical protein
MENEHENGLLNKRVLITKTDGFQKKGILLELNKDFAKMRFRDSTIIVIPTMQISQIMLNEYERDIDGRTKNNE